MTDETHEDLTLLAEWELRRDLQNRVAAERERIREFATLTHLLEKTMRERDELRSRLMHAEADAEQAIHNEAFNERQRIVAWIRARHAHGSADCSLSLMALDALRVVGEEIERGGHER
jgi:hypothetical protein